VSDDDDDVCAVTAPIAVEEDEDDSCAVVQPSGVGLPATGIVSTKDVLDDGAGSAGKVAPGAGRNDAGGASSHAERAHADSSGSWV